MKLQVSVKNHIMALFPALFVSLFFIFMFVYIQADIELMAYAFLPYAIIFILPVLILHLNYLKNSKTDEYIINDKGITKLFKNGAIEGTYSYSEFSEIKIIMTSSRLHKFNSRFLFDKYYYIECIFETGESIIVTCLYSYNLDTVLRNHIPDTKLTTEGTFYPYIPG